LKKEKPAEEVFPKDKETETGTTEFKFKPVDESKRPKMKPSADEEMAKLEKNILTALEKGFLTKGQVTAIFKIVNHVLLNDYHDREGCELMGSVWYAPMNRLFMKYKDADIYIAIALTALWLIAPFKKQIVESMKSRGKKKEPKKEEKKEDGSKGKTESKTES